MTKWRIEITVDENDGDALTEVGEIEEGKDLEAIRRLMLAVRARSKRLAGKWHHNFPAMEHENIVREVYPDMDDEIDIFLEYAPFGEHGFHTIESVRLMPITEVIELL